jgi:triacylglycerol esterase/lipase EstA (alpha/beta hydrolase family)
MKTVILIHGLHMSAWNFYFMKKELQKDKSLNIKTFDYNSLLYNDSILARLHALVSAIDTHEIVFVSHSLGGLVSRLYLDKYKPELNIKLITLGTPHQGSLVAQKIHNTILRPVLGFSTKAGLIKTRVEWDNKYPLISIAGIKSIGIAKLFTNDTKNDSDGTVFVSETIVKNATKHIILNNIHHTQLITHKTAINEVKKWI